MRVKEARQFRNGVATRQAQKQVLPFDVITVLWAVVVKVEDRALLKEDRMKSNPFFRS
ncbi:hypothetical protein [Paenibacillus sp. RC67]|uniref:hypothetical protein n=1 Tax=Paenibacillus sp. RC67 TaxID=3039392 RepID=UPI0024ADAEA4|nr:hypothetical protein [Paenibacillus sp. RC67]